MCTLMFHVRLVPSGILAVLSFTYFKWRGASLIAQMVKNPPAMREIQVQFLGREDPLEKGMATHSSIPPLKMPWIEEPVGLQSMGSQRV